MRRCCGTLLLLATLAGASASAGAEPGKLLPLPNSVRSLTGRFEIVDRMAIGVPAGDRAAAATARLLAERVRNARGLKLSTVTGPAPIRIVRDRSIAAPEGYRLTVDERGVTIAASGDRGLLWGAMTLAQLVDPTGVATTGPVTLDAVAIADAPRFAWRGLMVDVARHFLPIGELRTIVDQMSAVKLNTLHLHLSDDQGWRFEVKSYPRLTEVGAWRTPPSTGGPARPRVGGFYTQAELKALVAYAAERGVTIVPEIDLPGHAQALVAAYPEFGVFGDRPKVSGDWGVNPYLVDPSPKGVAFVKAVLDELIAVFPGKFIHLGGDEAIKDQWQRSPAVQAQIASLKLKDENALQSWLIDQYGAYLAGKGRRLIGWDEILEGGLPPSASVMSWRGEAGAVAAANAGHDVVLSPVPVLYLNFLQSDRADELPGHYSNETLAKVYAYDPMPAAIDRARAHHVLGVQGNVWSEYIVTPHQFQHAMFPRAGAIAELGWTDKAQRDFAGFLPRIDAQARRWRAAGVEVADSAFAVGYKLTGTRGDALRAERASVALSTQAPYGVIRYTLDGTQPTARSAGYSGPLAVASGVTIRAAAFREDGTPTAAPRSFETGRPALLARSSSELSPCRGDSFGMRVPLWTEATADTPVFNIAAMNTCSVYPAAPLDVARGFVIDVARLPRNWAFAHEFDKVRQRFNVTPFGELLVTIGCPAKGVNPVVAGTFPLPDPASAPQRFRFEGALPPGKTDADLCLQFTAPTGGPFYAVEQVQLTERAP